MNTLSPSNCQDETKKFVITALVAAVCFFLVHLLIIFRFGPTSDEIWDLTEENSGIYLAGGRFTITIYRFIFSPCGVPVAYGIASSLYFGLAIATQIKIFNIQNKNLQFLFIAFSVSCVQLSYFMSVCYHADVLCFGILAVCFSYFLFNKAYTTQRKSLFCLSAIPAVIGLGAYQFLGVLLPCLFIIQILCNQAESSQSESLTKLMKKCGVFGAWCFGIIVIYFLFANIGKTFCSEADLNLTRSYQAPLLLWGKLPILTHILHMGKAWCMHLIGTNYSGEWLYVTAILPLTLFVQDLWKKNRPVSLRLVYVSFALSLYFLIPFLPIVAMGRDLGARVYLAQPLTCAAIWSLALFTRVQTIKNWLIISVSTFILIKACYTVSDIAFYDKRLFEESLILRNEVIARALQADVPSGVDVYACPILVNKELNTSIRKQNRYSNCIPNCGSRAFDFYLDISVSNMRKIYRHEKEFIPIFKQMPVYPAPGSIKYHEGNILVKLGD